MFKSTFIGLFMYVCSIFITKSIISHIFRHISSDCSVLNAAKIGLHYNTSLTFYINEKLTKDFRKYSCGKKRFFYDATLLFTITLPSPVKYNFSVVTYSLKLISIQIKRQINLQSKFIYVFLNLPLDITIFYI